MVGSRSGGIVGGDNGKARPAVANAALAAKIPPKINAPRSSVVESGELGQCPKPAGRGSDPPWRGQITELQLHRAVADFLDWMLPVTVAWTTFPAGWTAMNRGAAGRLKGCGLKAGMPDILIFYCGRAIGIELKTGKGRVSKVQMATAERLDQAGVHVWECRSLDDVKTVLQHESIPCRTISRT